MKSSKIGSQKFLSMQYNLLVNKYLAFKYAQKYSSASEISISHVKLFQSIIIVALFHILLVNLIISY